MLFEIGKDFGLEGLGEAAEGFALGVRVDGASEEGLVFQLFEGSFDEGFSFDAEQCLVDDFCVLCLRSFFAACLQALHARGFSACDDDEGCRLCFCVFHKEDG